MKNLKLLPHKSGIYRVYTNFNNACYIGQAKDIFNRFNSHHIYGYLNPNDCCYNTKFYKALRNNGIENFEVEIVELCDIKDLDSKEIYYIEYYDSFYHGYNSTKGGQNWSPNIHSDESELKRQITRELNQSLKGENHPRAKLTNEEVIKIRQRYIDGESVKEIYQDFKDKYTSIETFKRIILGKTYISVGNIPQKNQIRHTNAKLTEQQVKEIRRRYKNEKISQAKLGKEFGLSASSIGQIIRKETYQNID